MHTQQDCRALDAQDPLRPLRDLFTLPEGVIYLDGNSLGARPKAAPARIAQVTTQEWGQELIRAWNTAHPSSRHVLVDRPLAWTFVQNWNTPQFLFLVDGKLVEHVEGWPDDGQKVALMKAARRAREIRATEAVP